MGDPPGRDGIRDTSNSRKIHFGGGFALLLKLTIESHCTEGCSKSNKWVKKCIYRQNTWFASIFLVYVLSDHSIILRKCTPGWRGCKIACKGGLFFLLHLRRLPHLPGVPHLHVNRPLKSILLGCVYTIPDSSFWPATKITADIGRQVTHKNGCGGAIFVTERCCTAPISKMESHISDRGSHSTTYVSGKLPTYPSPQLTLTFTSHLGQNFGLRGGGGTEKLCVIVWTKPYRL